MEIYKAIKNGVKSITQDDVIGFYNHSEEFLDVVF